MVAIAVSLALTKSPVAIGIQRCPRRTIAPQVRPALDSNQKSSGNLIINKIRYLDAVFSKARGDGDAPVAGTIDLPQWNLPTAVL
jgi:hypothetical protein